MNRYYICDGYMDCAYRKDGKKNEYCYRWGMENSWCKHTDSITHAKYLDHIFNEDGFETEKGR